MNSTDVRNALAKHFAPPEYAILYEVGNGTGAAVRRHVDMVAVNLWPSRGLIINGVEIKVSTGDWRREKKNPAKADPIIANCDFFWVAAPVGVVPIGELPYRWGLIEISDAGKCKIAQPASAISKVAHINRLFFAACLRAATRPVSHEMEQSWVAQERKKLHDEFEQRVIREAERRTQEATVASRHWNELMAALGEDAGYFYHDEQLIAAVKAVMHAGVSNSYNGIKALRETMRDMHKRLESAVAMFNGHEQ